MFLRSSRNIPEILADVISFLLTKWSAVDEPNLFPTHPSSPPSFPLSRLFFRRSSFVAKITTVLGKLFARGCAMMVERKTYR